MKPPADLIIRSTLLVGVLSTAFWGSTAGGQAPSSLQQVLIEGATPQTLSSIKELNNKLGAKSLKTIDNSAGDLVVGVPKERISEWKNALSELEKANTKPLSMKSLTGDYRSLLHPPVSISNLTKKQAELLQLQRKTYGAENISVFKIAPPALSKQVLNKGFDSADGFQKQGSFQLPLEAGKTVDVEPTSISTTGDGALLWKGQVRSSETPESSDSDATIINKGGNLTGNVRVGTEYYSIMPIGDGLHTVSKRDPARLPKDHPPSSADEKESGNFDAPPTDPIGPDESVELNILFAFTTPARERQPNYAEDSQLVISELQEIIVNSGIDRVRVRLAGAIPVNYAEGVTWSKHWDAIFNNKHKGFSEVFKQRDARKADIVIIVVADTTWCGEVKTPLPVSHDRAIALVSLPCLLGPKFSVAHEIGHMLGALHDRVSDPAHVPFRWGHGYVSPGQDWRTIMAYDICNGCPRIKYWSNPNVKYKGYPMGTDEYEFDAKTWMLRAKITANFR